MLKEILLHPLSATLVLMYGYAIVYYFVWDILWTIGIRY